MIPCASISLAQTISQCLHCFAAATHIPVVALPTGSIRACLARGRSTAYIRIIKTPPPFVNGFWMGIIKKRSRKPGEPGKGAGDCQKAMIKPPRQRSGGACGGKGPAKANCRQGKRSRPGPRTFNQDVFAAFLASKTEDSGEKILFQHASAPRIKGHIFPRRRRRRRRSLRSRT